MNETNDTQPKDIPQGHRVYEISYLLAPVVSEEDIQTEAKSLQDIITDNDGQLIAAAEPEFIDLAHTIEHTLNQERHEFDKAYFGWMHIAVEGAQLEEIQAAINTAEHTLRSLCISLDPEHAGRHSSDESDEEEEAEEAKEDEAAADTEEMDEAIDELVIEE